MLSGLRVRFRVGDTMRVQDAAIFDVEDFEGWHVWRWGADPTSPSYEGIGEYSKLVDTAAGAEVWPGHNPYMRRVVFVDPFGIFALVAAGLLIALLGPFIALTRRPLRCPHCRREVPYHTKGEADAADREDAERRVALGIERPHASS